MQVFFTYVRFAHTFTSEISSMYLNLAYTTATASASHRNVVNLTFFHTYQKVVFLFAQEFRVAIYDLYFKFLIILHNFLNSTF